MSGGERGKVISLIGTVMSGAGLGGCREGKAGDGLKCILGVGFVGFCGGARYPGGCMANEVAVRSGGGSLYIQDSDGFSGVRGQ